MRFDQLMAFLGSHAIRFDLDGTLTEAKPDITRSSRHALAALGHPAPAHDDLAGSIGPPLLDSLEKLLGDRQQAAAALPHYRDRFSHVGLYENKVYPGIREALAGLRRSGHRLFVAGSKPWV